MTTKLSNKDYVTFARRWVEESVDTMGIEELKDFAITALHEDIQEIYDDIGQRGAFDEMIGWDEDTFDNVAKDYDLTLEDDEEL